MRRSKEQISLNWGGHIRIRFQAYPEWGKYFESIPQRCDRCWESTGRYSKRHGSSRWLCEKCKWKHIGPDDRLSDWEVTKRKVSLRLKRWMWNRTHERQIPNQPGHSR